MHRESLVPRPDWPRKVEELGFHFHTMDGVYWDESACYRFSAAEIDKLEAATGELQSRCIVGRGVSPCSIAFTRNAVASCRSRRARWSIG